MVPSKVKFASSSSEPAVPAITTRLLVRSLTVADASVDSPVTPKVPAIKVLPVPSATVNLFVSTAIPPFALSKPVNVDAPEKLTGPFKSIVPVPLGSSTMLPLVSVEVIVLPLRVRLSTLSTSIFELASTIIADDAVSVPCA